MNRLAATNSPYLLQHADNPVDWYPWGEEAFAAARRDDKPIFLSVGYSTCHWCHVMAHESFESPEIAALLNEHFVPVKVDREERPDVDRVYMTFVQATTGAGGWPMSVWLTPDLRPFYGGTYFPPESRHGRPGFPELLRELARLWRDERARVLESAESVREELVRAAVGRAGPRVPPAKVLEAAVDELRREFDDRYGGFGRAPKFPRPSELLFLLREHARTGDARALEMATATLRAMSAGGMRDQLGGGFHRYSVDDRWRVPHFEKMLYDQAQIVLALLEAAQANDGGRDLVEVAEDTLAYVRRDLTDPAGGFYSAEDADSLPPGAVDGAHPTEGAFYLWRADEIDALLGADAGVVKTCFGVSSEGNALNDPHGEFRGGNILYRAASDEEAAARHGVEPAAVAAIVARARERLFEARSARPRPGLDDKVLAAWNGLMIAAFARASRVVAALDPLAGPRADDYLTAAARAAAFARDRLWDEGRQRLLRRYRAGEAGVDGYAEDYACLAFGLIELFQASGDPAHLRFARLLQRRQDELFWDAETGGWFGTTGEDPSMLLRLKEEYDGAEPAASSVGALNLVAFSQLDAEGDALGRVEQVLRAFEPRLSHTSRAVPMMLAALSAYHAPRQEIVVAGDPADPRTRALITAVESRYRPFAIVVRLAPERADDLVRELPHAAGMGTRGGAPAAYVCRNFACEAPVTDPGALPRG